MSLSKLQELMIDWESWSAAVQFNSVQLLSRVLLSATRWTAARQASLSISNSQNLPKLMSITWVMPSNHLILCGPLLLPPSIFPSIRIFSNESVLSIRRSNYWSFSFSISPSNEYVDLQQILKWKSVSPPLFFFRIVLAILIP